MFVPHHTTHNNKKLDSLMVVAINETEKEIFATLSEEQKCAMLSLLKSAKNAGREEALDEIFSGSVEENIELELDETKDFRPTLTRDERKDYRRENLAMSKKYSKGATWVDINNSILNTCNGDIARQLAKLEWTKRAWTCISYVNPNGKTKAFLLRCADGQKHEVRYSVSGGKMLVAFKSKPTFATNKKLESIGLYLQYDGMYAGKCTEKELFSICPKQFNSSKHVYNV